MTGHTMRGDNPDTDRIETVLLLMTVEDGTLVELPADLWDNIATQVQQTDDQAKLAELDQRRRFPISIEPRDENANHSGRSTLRGPLAET